MENEIIGNEVVLESVDGGRKAGHGGARRGAGRKRIADRGCRVAFGLSVKAKENLSRYASELGISMNEVVVRLLEGLY